MVNTVFITGEAKNVENFQGVMRPAPKWARESESAQERKARQGELYEMKCQWQYLEKWEVEFPCQIQAQGQGGLITLDLN